MVCRRFPRVPFPSAIGAAKAGADTRLPRAMPACGVHGLPALMEPASLASMRRASNTAAQSGIRFRNPAAQCQNELQYATQTASSTWCLGASCCVFASVGSLPMQG